MTITQQPLLPLCNSRYTGNFKTFTIFAKKLPNANIALKYQKEDLK